MFLIPTNMLSLDFGPCKKKLLKNVPAKFFVFKNSPWTHFLADLACFC